jgi:hypothetical protein
VYKLVETEAEKLGIKLNASKCNIVVPDKQSATIAAYSSKVTGIPDDSKKGVPRDEAVRLLGAAVASTAEKEIVKLSEIVSKSTETMFDRLRHLVSPAGMSILSMAGIPRMNHLIRAHEPAVVLKVVKEFDMQTRRLWQQWALCDADETSCMLAALPFKMGGMGLTPQLEIMRGAYIASRDKALRSSADGVLLSQKAHTLQTMHQIAEKVDAVDPAIARHREHASTPATASLFRNPRIKCPAKAFSGAIRARLLAPIAGAGSALSECPGCGMKFPSQREFYAHSPNCAKVKGSNCSARHAAIKICFKAFLARCGIGFDNQEPRQARQVHCLCGVDVPESEFGEHAKTCSQFRGRSLTAGVRGSGPDILVHVVDEEQRSVVVDITVVAAGCNEHRGKPLDTVFNAVQSEKRKKYDKQLERQNMTLCVAGFTELGAPSRETTSFVTRNAGNSAQSELYRMCAGATAAHGAAVANAESQAGVRVDHTTWKPRQRDVALLALDQAALAKINEPPPTHTPANSAPRPFESTYHGLTASSTTAIAPERPALFMPTVAQPLVGATRATTDGAASSPPQSNTSNTDSSSTTTSASPLAPSHAPTTDSAPPANPAASQPTVVNITNNTTIINNNGPAAAPAAAAAAAAAAEIEQRRTARRNSATLEAFGDVPLAAANGTDTDVLSAEAASLGIGNRRAQTVEAAFSPGGKSWMDVCFNDPPIDWLPTPVETARNILGSDAPAAKWMRYVAKAFVQDSQVKSNSNPTAVATFGAVKGRIDRAAAEWKRLNHDMGHKTTVSWDAATTALMLFNAGVIRDTDAHLAPHQRRGGDDNQLRVTIDSRFASALLGSAKKFSSARKNKIFSQGGSFTTADGQVHTRVKGADW